MKIRYDMYVKIAILLIFSLIGCNGSQEALETCNAEKLRIEKAYQSCESELVTVSKTPDAVWSKILSISGDRVLERRESLLIEFLNLFPNDARNKQARSLLIKLQKRKDALEEFAKSKSVTIQHLETDPEGYENQTFQRTACCTKIKLSQYGVPTGLSGLQWETSKLHNSTCYWDIYRKGRKIGNPEIDVDYSENVEVRMQKKMAKSFPDEAIHKEMAVNCDYLIEGEFEFLGQISQGRPVMYLQSVNFDPSIELIQMK